MAKSRKSIINSIIERRAKKPIILVADAEEPDEVIATQADEAVKLVDQEVVTEPFIENLEDPEGAKSRKKYHQIVCRIAGGAGTIIEAVSEASGRRSHYT